MLSELCRELNNWFVETRFFCDFKIEDNVISPSDFILPNQYFRIVGSHFNDGVYKLDDKLTLVDEEFSGAIWTMNIPPEVISLADEIVAWKDKYKDSIESPYQSESFGGYSYNKSSGVGSGGGWKSAFSGRLNKWRKL